MQKNDPMRERAQEEAKAAETSKGVVRPTIVAGQPKRRMPPHLAAHASRGPRPKPLVR